MKDDKVDVIADSHSIVARWTNYLSQILNVQGVKDVRQTEIHAAELLVLEPSASYVELVIEKLKSHRLQGIDQIPAELIKARGKKIRCQIHKLLFLFGIRRNCLTNGRSRS